MGSSDNEAHGHLQTTGKFNVLGVLRHSFVEALIFFFCFLHQFYTIKKNDEKMKKEK